MPEVYTEQLVIRENDSGSLLKKAGIIALAALLTAANYFILSRPALGGGAFIIVAEAAIIFGAYILLRMQNIEYEYIFMEDVIQFDRITSRSSRKKLYTAECAGIEILARCDGPKAGEYLGKKYVSTRDYSSGSRSGKRWFAVLDNGKGGRELLIFEPNEKIVEAVRSIIPRKVML